MIKHQKPWAIETILRMYVQEEKTMRHIATHCNILVCTVRRILKLHGVHRPMQPAKHKTINHLPPSAKRIPLEEAWAAYHEPGASLASVGRKYGVCTASVRQCFLFNGKHVRSLYEHKQWLLDTLTPEQQRARSRAGSERYKKNRSPEAQERAAMSREITQSMATPEAIEIANQLEEFGPVIEMAVSRYNVDIGFPSLRVAVEVDGGGWHELHHVLLRRDHRKEMLLRALGFICFRIQGISELEYMKGWLQTIRQGQEQE